MIGLSTPKQSRFRSSLRMSGGLLIMDGSSTPETKSQQHWAAVNPLRCIPMVLWSLWRALTIWNHTTWQCTQPWCGSYWRLRRILPFFFTEVTKVLVQYIFTSNIGPLQPAPDMSSMCTIRPLKRLQNSAAQLAFNLHVFKVLSHCPTAGFSRDLKPGGLSTNPKMGQPWLI